MEIGDCFADDNHALSGVKTLPIIYKIITFSGFNVVECDIIIDGRIVGNSVEHRNILLKMRKLSELEKELM